MKQADEDVPARHRRVRATARRETHLHYAKVQNIPMRFPDPPGCTHLALAVLAELDSCDAFVSRAFEAYWRDNLSLNEAYVVQTLLEPGSFDVSAMKAEHMVERRLREANQRALDLGVIDAPGYLIDGEVFIGREHLPWIRELLTEKRKKT
jgi:2-hydroxychromene-2-carboxylate isomerase